MIFQYYSYYKDFINNDSKEIKNLKEELNKLIEQQKSKINELEEKLKLENDQLNKLHSLKSSFLNKNNDLNNLKNQLIKISNNMNNLNQSINKINDKAVTFISNDENIIFAIPCSGNDKFSEIEEKLYKEYPQYRDKNNIFLADGKEVLKTETINYNKIGTGRPIMLVKPHN